MNFQHVINTKIYHYNVNCVSIENIKKYSVNLFAFANEIFKNFVNPQEAVSIFILLTL